MDNNMLERAEQALAKKKKRSVWLRIVSVLGCVVVFCTTYALILPAITMNRQTICGQEEHAHTAQCYETRTVEGEVVLSCGAEEELHVHSDSCYDSNHVAVCGYANFYVHVHNSSCYEGDTLVCDLQEIKEYTHEGNCFEREQKLICTLEEGGEAHVHGDDCYTEEKTLICTLEEGGEVHAHEDGCYTQEQTLTCGQEEAEGVHTHSEECYTTESKLVCEKEEKTEVHNHTDECYNVSSALTCEKEEVAEVHTHTEECYETVERLTCRKTEVKLHTHGSSCFQKESDGSETLVCTQMQVLEHVHSDSCFAAKTEQVVICGIEEHSHEDACYPAEETTEPAEDETTSTEGENEPTEGETMPTEGETMPTEGETMPAEEETTPVEDKNEPTEGETVPTETVPAEETTPTGDGFISAEISKEAPVYLSDGSTEVASGTHGDNLTWTVTEQDGVQTLTISGEGEMKTVDSSSYPWYTYRTSINRVVIDQGITTISEDAFYYNYTNISTVYIADSVTAIGDCAFYYCSSLTSIEIPDSVTSIGYCTFCGCSSLTSIEIPDGVTSIGDSAFSSCSSLTSIDIPASVTSIGNAAFSSCRSLTSIEIPDGVTSIGYDTFYYCSNLTSIVIPDSVASIGDYAFDNCSSLTSVELPEGVTSIGRYAFYECWSLESIEIPGSVTSFGDYAFSYCDGLASVMIGDGVTTIGEAAFAGCTSLGEIIIPDSVTTIGSVAFGGCSGLTKVTIPDSVTTIGSSAFSDCTGLTEITIPESVTTVGSYAFNNCTGLTSVTIEDGVSMIGSHMFSGCTGLTEIVIPDSVTSIRYGAFEDCTGLKEIVIPNSVTSIEYWAFMGCTALTEIVIPDSVTSIEHNTFVGCTGLTEIVIPDSINSIGGSAFENCTGLTSVVFPSGFLEIGAEVLSGCTNLPSTLQSLPGGDYYIDEQGVMYTLAAGAAFVQYQPAGTSLLSSITDEDTGAIYTVVSSSYVAKGSIGANVNWIIYDIETERVLEFFGTGDMDGFFDSGSQPWNRYMSSIDTVIIADGVTNINFHAFYNHTNLSSVYIADTVTNIGADAFYGCTGLTSVKIPDDVTRIGEYAFYNCTGLTSVDLPTGFVTIYANAFSGCTQLDISLRNLPGLKYGEKYYIDEHDVIYCFADDTAYVQYRPAGAAILDYIVDEESGKTYPVANEINIASGIYGNITWEIVQRDGKRTLYITGKGGMPNDNDTRPPWYSYRSTIQHVEVADGVTHLGNGAFADFTNLASVKLPDSVTSIGNKVFENCTSLTSIRIPENVGSIYWAPFNGCTALETIYLDAAHVKYCNTAFGNCKNLKNVVVGSSVDTLYTGLFGRITGDTGKSINDLEITFEGRNYFTLDANYNFGENWPFLSAGYSYYVDENGAVYLVDNGTAYYLYSPMSGYIAPKNIPTEAFDGTTYPVYSAKLPDVVKRNGDLIWMVYGDQLVILGESEIPNYSETGAPWYSYGSDIREIVLADTITGIGHFAFNGFTRVTEVEIPRDTTTVSTSAFRNCTSLRNFAVDTENTAFSEVNGILYNKDQTVLILCPPAKRSAQQIPATVTTIGNYAFAYNDALTGVKLPESLTTISDYAFYDCDALTGITIPGETVTVGENAFYDCDGLTTVRITAADAELGKNAFYDCDAVTAVTVNSTTSTIGEGAFRSCDGLEQVKFAALPDAVSAYAFADCGAVTTFDVPAGYTVIGEGAFSGTSLTPLNQAKSGLHYVDGQGALYWICDGLAYYVGCPETVEDYRMLSQTPKIGDYGPYPVDSDVSSFLDYGTTGDLYWYIVDDNGRQTLVITGEGEMPSLYPDTMPWYAYRRSVVDLEIKDGVTSIAFLAFERFEKLANVTISDSVKSIEGGAFEGCTSLIEIVIPESTTGLYNAQFRNCTKLTKVILPEGYFAVSSDTFTNTPVSYLKGTIYTDTNGVQYKIIDEIAYVVSRPEGVTNDMIPDYIDETGNNYPVVKDYANVASGQCGENLYWEIIKSEDSETLHIYGTGAMRDFYNTGCPWYEYKELIDTVVIEEGATTIGRYAFYYCDNLTSVTFPEGLTSIGADAFRNCDKLTSITFPEGYISINNSAFSETSMEYLKGTIYTDASGVRYRIHNETAYVVFQPENVADDMIPEYIDETGKNYPVEKGAELIDGGTCGQNLYWKILETNDTGTLYIYGTGNMYNYAYNTVPWISHRERIDKVVIEEGATSIGDYAFYDCASLAEATIPDTLQSIGDTAFWRCEKLTEIVIPDSVTEIDEFAFLYCAGLKKIKLSESITELRAGTFSRCRSLPGIEIPDSVTTIYYRVYYGLGAAFDENDSLEWVRLGRGLKTIQQETFYGNDKLSVIYLASSDLTSVDGTAFQRSYKVDHVIVEPGVDILRSVLFTAIKNYSGWPTVQFTGPNHFVVDESFGADALSNLGPAASKMAPGGSYYVDAQGAIYEISDGAATLLYVPEGITEFTIPATIPAADEGEETVPVIGVASAALEAATDLTALVFEAPETITSLADGCMANCPTLMSVNGKTTVREAKSIFTNENLTMGVSILENTGLVSELEEWLSQCPTSEGAINVETEGVKVVVTTSTEKNAATEGNMAFYTGQEAKSSIYFARLSENHQESARIYFCFSNPGETFNLGVGTKKFDTVAPSGADSYKYEVNVSKLPYTNIYCMELEPLKMGHTVEIPVPYQYANGTEGGEVLVWAEVTGTEASTVASSVIQKLTWETEPYDFSLTKKVRVQPKFSGDGTEGSSFAIYDLSYEVKLSPINNSRTAPANMGKDALTRAEFVDVLTFPDSENGQKLRWADGIMEAVANGEWVSQKYMENNKQVGWEVAVPIDGQLKTLLAVRDTAATDLKVWLTEENSIAFGWTKANSNINTANPTFTQNVDVGDGMIVGETIKNLSEDKEFQLENKVSADQYFMYSDEQNDEAQCEHIAKTNAAVMEAKKTADRGYTAYFGESYPYTITLKNTGTQHLHALNNIEDDLPADLYITPEDMFAMLTEGRDGEYLTITISEATIYNQLPAGLSVTGTDGKEYVLDIQNTSIETWYHGMEWDEAGGCIASTGAKLVLKQAEGGVSVSLNGGELRIASNADELRHVLFDLGYFVTPLAKYNVTWKFPEGTSMWSSEERDYHILSTVKDAFMSISWDHSLTPIWDGSEPVESKEMVANYAKISYVLSEGMEPVSGEEVKVERATTLKRDFWISTEYWTGTHGGSLELIEGGGLVNLCVSVDHDGTASYDMLPFVSQMTGAQILVVRVADNPHLAAEGYGLTVRTIGGIDYYLLDRDGEYPNVKIGGYLADCVKVDVNDENRNDITTQMRWYLTNIKGQMDMHIDCKVLMVTNGEITDSSVFGVDNEVWLNDHQTHRLWASMGSKWSFASFDKQIVTNHVEGTSVHDVTDPDDETVLHDGASVTYRLKIAGMLSSASVQAGRTVVVPGTAIYDQLPKSTTDWEFGKNIRKIEYVYNDAQVDIEGLEQACWTLTDADPETGETEVDQQYIVWNDLFRIIYHETSTVYIYITLDYPEGAGWGEYCYSYGSDMVTNTMYFSDDNESVRHSLDMSASAKLVKGVSSTGVWKNNTYYPSSDSNSRFNYASEDNLNRIVTYYVALYNDGYTRLYLDDIQDKLPVGLTYRNGSVSASSEIAEIGDDLGQEVTYKKAVISAAVEESTGNLRFTAGNGAKKDDGTYEGNLNYDEIYERYYLQPREALVFSYQCFVGPEAENGIRGTNTAAMAYFDYNLCGVNVGASTVTASGAEQIFSNDGDCNVISDSTAGTYDFSSDLGEGTQWLMSQVQVEKGNIVPGIEKRVAGVYANLGANVEISRTQATYYDYVTWEVTTSNIGTTPMRDYVLTDVMQHTYDFEDAVKYTIHYGSNYTDNLSVTDTLFKMENLIRNENLNAESGQYTMSVTSNVFGALDVTYTPHSEETPAVLAIHFKSAKAAIPEGGESVLSVTTRNRDTFRTSTYTNTCYVTPAQTWDERLVTTGVQEEYNGKPSVRNSADIAVDSAYLTASLKEVSEKINASNRADSDDEVNSIVLSSGESSFTYTLKVQNTGEEKDVMDMLVIIDSLPEIGDHSVLKDTDPRYSEFTVWLAEDPNFSVTVGAETLEPSEYSLQFSTQTRFSKDDWAGAGTGWSNEPAADTRSFRIVLTGTENEDGTYSGTIVPANTLVTVSFDAMIKEDDLENGAAMPGETAWNSFGYNYSLVDSDVELASVPGKVGVKLPSVPVLLKQLQTPDGRTWNADTEQYFSYLIYALEEGLNLPELDGLTEAQIGEELQKANAKFTRVCLTVPEDASESELLMLKGLHHWSVADGVWTEGNEEWTWTQDGQYVFLEMPLEIAEGEIEEYTFGTLNSNHRNHYVYVHNQAEEATIVGVNLRRVWNISLLKVSDGKQANPLSGAWFGLYGKTAPAGTPVLPETLTATVTEKDFEKLLTLEHTEGEQTTTWYLQSINVSGSDGILLWQDLTDEQYLVQEIQAPEGYHYDDTVHVVQRPEDVIFNTVNMSVVNRSGYEMPKSGGIGTNAVTTTGALLIAASGVMLLLLKRRRKGAKS